MAGIYKLIFDLSLYYSLTGFYLVVFFRTPPSALGMLLLCAAVGLEAFLRGRNVELTKRVPVLALPIFALVVWPGLWPAIHLMPAWLYVGWSLVTGRINVEYEEFRGHYGFGLRLLLIMLPAFLLCKWVGEAFIAAVPYLALMLSVGVCLLRMLREVTPSGTKQAIFIMAFVAGCAILTVGRAPQMVLAVIKFLYQNVVAVVLLGAVLLLGMGFYGLFKGFFWLISLFSKGEEKEVVMDLRSAAEMLGLEDEFVDKTGDILWLRILGYILVALIVAVVLFFIFRRLLGKGRREENEDPWSELRESVEPGAKRRRRSVLRPRDPRMAVRYYYAKFLVECRRRGMRSKPGNTSKELAEMSAAYFPGGDTGQLAAIYAPARYSERAAVTPQDAERAKEAYSSLKKTKSPMD